MTDATRVREDTHPRSTRVREDTHPKSAIRPVTVSAKQVERRRVEDLQPGQRGYIGASAVGVRDGTVYVRQGALVMKWGDTHPLDKNPEAKVRCDNDGGLHVTISRWSSLRALKGSVSAVPVVDIRQSNALGLGSRRITSVGTLG